MTKITELKEEIERRENLPEKSKEAFETTIFYNDLKLKELKAELKGYEEAKKEFIEVIDKMPVVKRLKDGSQVPFKGESAIILTALKQQIKSSIIGSEKRK